MRPLHSSTHWMSIHNFITKHRKSTKENQFDMELRCFIFLYPFKKQIFAEDKSETNFPHTF